VNEDWQEQVTFLVSVLASTFQRQVTPAMLQGYLIGLSGMALEDVKQATQTALRTCKFMPAPAELRELAGDAKPEDAALIAWEIATRAVASVGWYGSVQFEDPAITATIRSLGGWQRFCERCCGDEEKWLRKEFLTTYASYRRTGVSPEAAMPMVGEFERQNRLMGFHRKEDRPCLVRCNGKLTPTPLIGWDCEDRDVKQLVAELEAKTDVERILDD
jgi:hypothetical protein